MSKVIVEDQMPGSSTTLNNGLSCVPAFLLLLLDVYFLLDASRRDMGVLEAAGLVSWIWQSRDPGGIY